MTRDQAIAEVEFYRVLMDAPPHTPARQEYLVNEHLRCAEMAKRRDPDWASK